MKIALLTTTLEGGGAARVMAHMANHWAAAGWGVTILSFEDGSAPSFYPLNERVQVTYLSLNRHSATLAASLVNNWRRCTSIRRAVMGNRPDALISFIDTANVRTLVALLGTGVPVIVSERIDPRFEKIGPLWNLLRRLTYPFAACLVVQTAQVGRYFRWFGLRRLEVIANPVSPVPATHEAPALPRPCLLAVGRLYPQKGYDLLLHAFAQVAAAAPDWSLCIAGDGPLRTDITRLAQELGLGDRVRLLGQVSDVGGLLAQADAYVLSSRYEGFPNSLCEAMAAGLPCVSTDCQSGPADIVTHGVDGLLVANENTKALADAVLQLMGDAELRQRLGDAARAVSERFSFERIMALWERCLLRCSTPKNRDRQ